MLEHPFYVDNKPIRRVLNDISEKPFIDLTNDYFSQHYNSLIKRCYSSIFEFFLIKMIFRMMNKAPIDRIDSNELNKIICCSYDIFVSYCADNKTEVNILYDELEKRDYKLWIDKKKMISGNTDELMKNGIDHSQLFMCCATTSYCASKNCMLEFNYAVNTDKTVIYILFEQFNGHDDRMKKLDKIAFRFAGQKYYKYDNLNGIVKAIEELRKVY